MCPRPADDTIGASLPETSSPPPALRVRGASRQLAGRFVLRDVALDVPRGTLVVLAGPNGAGKSSLLRAVIGRLALGGGTVMVDGRPAAEARVAGRIGVVPQDIALDPHLTVRENLRLWARLGGLPGASVAGAVQHGLRWAALDDRANAAVGTLSGGMRRRVNLLAGLLHGPPLLLLDEPTAGLDQPSRAQFVALLHDLRRRDVGVLLVTHDLDELGDQCDAIAVMDGGRVVAHGAPAALVARFGSRDGEVVVDLAAEPSPSQRQALERARFTPQSAREWATPGGVDDIGEVQRRIAHAGMAVDAVRWRRPTLQSAVEAAIAHSRQGDA